MKLNGIDLNLLVAFDALMSEANVTHAAERLSVGQPAMSASLSRLRKLLGDPILVQEQGRLVPTPVAASLIVPVREALGLIESALSTRRSFRPECDARTFSIVASDYVLLVLLQGLFTEFASEAPNVRIEVQPVMADYADRLRRGSVDLAILPAEVAGAVAGLPSAELFSDRYVCAVDADNPQVGDTMTVEAFHALPYLAYSGGTFPSVAELRLEASGNARTIEITTQSFVVAPFLLTGTRFVALIHEKLGRRVSGQAHLRLLEPPVKMDPLTETMYWNGRHTHDPGHQWLRARLSQAAAQLA